MTTPSRYACYCPLLDLPQNLRKREGRYHEVVEDAGGMYHESAEGPTDHC